MKRLTWLLAVVVGAVFVLTATAAAQTDEESYLGGKIRFGDRIAVDGSDTHEGDLYAFGNTVRVDGTVTGDVVAFASSVTVTGTVGGDLMVGAGTLDVAGEVTGDVRVGAGDVSASGVIGEDVFVGSGLARIGGDVGGDLVFGTGRMDLSGGVAGDVLGSTGTYTKTGTIGGSETVEIEPEAEKPAGRTIVAKAVTRYLAVLLIGLGLLWVRRPWISGTVEAISRQTVTVIGWGALFVFGLLFSPFTALILGILFGVLFAWLGLDLLVGLMVVMVLLVWVLALAIGFIVIGFLAPIGVGAWLGAVVLPDRTPAYLDLVAGLAVLVLLSLVPILDFFLGVVVTVVGAGAWLSLGRRRRPSPTTQIPVPD